MDERWYSTVLGAAAVVNLEVVRLSLENLVGKLWVQRRGWE